jgi:hypothetical protein
MARIIYVIASAGLGVQGGHKIMMRHVEALCELGFDALCYLPAAGKPPEWFAYDVPIEIGTPVRHDDVIVLPEDAGGALQQRATRPQRTVIMMQNQYYFAASNVEQMHVFNEDNFPDFIALGKISAAFVGRLFPKANVEVVPCFADERTFRPQAKNGLSIAYSPRKRMLEAQAIKALLPKFHPRYAAIPWTPLINVHEAEMARAFGAASLCLSLSRMESVGMTPIEAMASGCVCAGFTGIGGIEYATPANGFWVAEDDCEAATDALARAADLVLTGGPPLQRHLEAGYETARIWSYANFKRELEATWMRLAPQARRSAARVA